MSCVRVIRCAAPWIIVLTVVASSFAEKSDSSLKWETDFVQAQKTRVETKQPMIIFLTMDNCPHCYRMMLTTYRDGAVAEQIRSQYVATVVNATRQDKLARQLGGRIYPTTVLVSPDNRVVDRMEGYVSAEELGKRLSVVSQHYAKSARAKADLQR